MGSEVEAWGGNHGCRVEVVEVLVLVLVPVWSEEVHVGWQKVPEPERDMVPLCCFNQILINYNIICM